MRPPIHESRTITAPPEPRRPALGDRILALGGYLAFASVLLLVVLTGFRLFSPPEATPLTFQVAVPKRDSDRIRLDAKEFLPVSQGVVFRGRYDIDQLPRDESVDTPFRMLRHEVTNDQYFEFLLALAGQGDSIPGALYPITWPHSPPGSALEKKYEVNTGNQPVLGISFDAAQRFCAWLHGHLGFDEKVLVDLPTFDEYLRAARGDQIDYNFPWGRRFTDTGGNFSGRPLAISLDEDGERELGVHNGFLGLVGNAAEWAYAHDLTHVAVGWSFENVELAQIDGLSPFDSEDVWVGGTERTESEDVGFRVVLRPLLPHPVMVPVEAGDVTFGDPLEALRPPVVLNDGDNEQEARLPVVRIQGRQHVHGFHIARTAVTNYQYLQYLKAVAADNPEALRSRWPTGWARPRTLRLPQQCDPGQENHPVEGVHQAVAEDYANWLSKTIDARVRLPNVAEYLRAGRGNKTTRYPWGDIHNDMLISAWSSTDLGRPVNLLGRFDARAPIYGLCGNLPELVSIDGFSATGATAPPDYESDIEDPTGNDAPPPAKHAYVLAGGCYRLPASVCTLDSYMALFWDRVDVFVTNSDDPDRPDDVTVAGLNRIAGFRVVRVQERP